ncbi:MAG: dienelactone hydrolase family protein [Treponema sp.]|jgi:dienelactone hydrolase|nr:dienelactone hydrolase family protein [Treponema sp.]
MSKTYDLRYSTIIPLQRAIQSLKEKQTHKFASLDEWKGFRAGFSRVYDELMRVPLDNPPVVSETIYAEQVEGIRMERVDISFCEGSYIPALVYNPPENIKKAKKPAVIVSPGWPQHKGENSHSWACKKLALAGYVTIMFDHVCFGERSEGFYFDAVNFDGRNQTEIHIESLCVMAGTSIMALRAWDNIRVLEYMLRRPDVDGRVGIIGLCQGGLDTWMASALDERFTATMVLCGTTSFAAWADELPRLSPLANATPYIPGIMKHGDFKHVFSLIAPRALLAINNFNDYWWPVSGFKETSEFVQNIFGLYGAGDKFQYSLMNREHTIYAYIDDCIEFLSKGAL